MNWFLEIVKAVLAALAVFTFLAVVGAMLGVYLERKISGWIQSRLGPEPVGPQGLASRLGPAFGRVLVVRDINIGLLFFIGMASLIFIAILLGGSSPNNKDALLGGFRS